MQILALPSIALLIGLVVWVWRAIRADWVERRDWRDALRDELPPGDRWPMKQNQD